MSFAMASTKTSFLAPEANWTFTLDQYPDAAEVLVTGFFTAAGAGKQQNKIRDEGIWEIPHPTEAHGKYLYYKFRVDGEWMIDPDNPAYEENEFGAGNSVLWIEPEGFTHGPIPTYSDFIYFADLN